MANRKEKLVLLLKQCLQLQGFDHRVVCAENSCTWVLAKSRMVCKHYKLMIFVGLNNNFVTACSRPHCRCAVQKI